MYTGFFPSHFYTFIYLLYSIILLKDKLNLSFEKHFALDHQYSLAFVQQKRQELTYQTMPVAMPLCANV